MKRIKWVALLLALALLTGCGADDASLQPAPTLLPAAGVASDIATAFVGDNRVLKTIEGSVAAYVEELHLTVNAVVDEVLVRPGDKVSAGQMLVSLDLENERRQAKSLEDNISYTRTMNDYENRISEIGIRILQTELDALNAHGADSAQVALKQIEIEKAKSSLAQAKEIQALTLSELESDLAEINEILATDGVYAPFDGVVARAIPYIHGSRIRAYDTVVYLADDTRLRFVTEYVSESSLKSATGGYYALIGDKQYEVKNLPIDQKEYLSQMLAGMSIYSDYEIIGPEGWENELEAGMYGALVLVNFYAENMVLIPANAVLSDAGGKYVYVVGENGERVKRDIKIRQSTGAIYAQVLEGLKEGERIYVTDK